MLDMILAWAVIFLPIALSIIFIFVPARLEDEKAHLKWRHWLVVFGILFGALAYWQQSHAALSASRDREDAITKTSENVSARVSESVSKSVAKSVGEQYTQTINDLQGKIGALEAQLQTQGKKVDVIGKSNIVTGKNPIRVEVTNPTLAASTGEPALSLHASSMSTTPETKYGQHATQIILTTNKRMNGAHLTIICKDKLNRGDAWISGTTYMMGGGQLVDEHTFQVDVGSPDWSPEFPLVVRFHHDVDFLGNCTITPR
jgi:hypothetical protein